ncbi:extensin family protein [Nannocystaceae bacterium ST9]
MNLLSTLPAWLLTALRLDVPVDPEPMRPPDEIVACEQRLTNSGIEFSPARISLHPSPDGSFTCGAPQVVRYERGPGKIRYSSKPKMACPLALAFADFERIIQEEARAHLGQEVEKIHHVGTYNCREMALYDFISEHSYANGMDISSFELADGRELTISKDYFDEDAGGQFLRALAKRIYAEGVFSVVMTPNADSLHKHHLHVDMAHYRYDGT